MANEEHLRILKQGVEAWNEWREKNYVIKSDLSKADLNGVQLIAAHLGNVNLKGANLKGANLSRARLWEADLSGACLERANLIRADLREANLEGAILSWADISWANLDRAILRKASLDKTYLREANLSGANLSEADLSRADLSKAILVETNFENANLKGCRIYGISAWNLKLGTEEKNRAIQENLIITPPQESEITVDNLEVAQFIYLILHSEKIRDVINTIGKKGVLILGRFTPPKRKEVLDAIRDKLRQLDYVPIVFDFKRPNDRDFTETIMTLAGMCCFIIADITNPRSSPLELQAVVPNYMIPFVAIIDKKEEPFAMFKDLTKYDWVMKPVLKYDSVDELMKGFEKGILKRALEKCEYLKEKRTEELVTQDIGEYQ